MCSAMANRELSKELRTRSMMRLKIPYESDLYELGGTFMNMWTWWRTRSRLRSQKPSVRECAYSSIFRSSDPDSCDPDGFNLLISALRNRDGRVCAGSADSLISIIRYNQFGWVRDRDSRTVKALLDVFDRHYWGYEEYGNSIFEKGSGNYQRNAGDQFAWKAAADALGQIGDPVALERLLQLTSIAEQGHESMSEVAAAAKGAAIIIKRRLIASLVTTYKQNGQYSSERVSIESLVIFLRDSFDEVRSEAADALGELGHPEGVAPLVAALKDPQGYVRHSAAGALGKIADLRALIPLVMSLQEKDMRWWAADAIFKLSSKQCPADRISMTRKLLPFLPQFVEALNHGDNSLRLGCAAVLGWIDDARVADPLIAVLQERNRREDDKSSIVQVAAERSLRSLLKYSRDQVSTDDLRAVVRIGNIDHTQIHTVAIGDEGDGYDYKTGHAINCSTIRELAHAELLNRKTN